jgi:hypothetical protein
VQEQAYENTIHTRLKVSLAMFVLLLIPRIFTALNLEINMNNL